MTTNTMKKAAGAPNTNGLRTHTDSTNSLPGDAINQARSKFVSTHDVKRLTTTSTSLVAKSMAPSKVE